MSRAASFLRRELLEGRAVLVAEDALRSKVK